MHFPPNTIHTLYRDIHLKVETLDYTGVFDVFDVHVDNTTKHLLVLGVKIAGMLGKYASCADFYVNSM